MLWSPDKIQGSVVNGVLPLVLVKRMDAGMLSPPVVLGGFASGGLNVNYNNDDNENNGVSLAR